MSGAMRWFPLRWFPIRDRERLDWIEWNRPELSWEQGYYIVRTDTRQACSTLSMRAAIDMLIHDDAIAARRKRAEQ
jgi:hypothetical protein